MIQPLTDIAYAHFMSAQSVRIDQIQFLTK